MPVVLLHGWALAQHTYRRVIEEIAEQGCMVIAPSMPGFGGSGDLKGAAFSMSGYAKWVADLLDVLEIEEPAVLVGHSFGGGVAIKLAHDMPTRVRSLVLVNSIGGSAWKSGRTLRSIGERTCGRYTRRLVCYRWCSRISFPTWCAIRGPSSAWPTWPGAPICVQNWSGFATAVYPSRYCGVPATASSIASIIAS